MHISGHEKAQGKYGPLVQLGWSPFFEQQLNTLDCATVPARIVGVRKNSFLASQGEEERLVKVAGSLAAGDRYPAVGDWVLLKDSLIVAILARQNTLARKAVGGGERRQGPLQEQVIAANLDRVFIVCGLDRDFNLRRIERYLTVIYNCAITPEIVLTKGDLHPDPAGCLAEVEAIAFGVPVHLVAADDEAGIVLLGVTMATGTSALIGSSGAGKSTLINRLCGLEVRATGAVGQRLGKGRHTTTSRDLIVLPSGGMLIDNPGIREIGLGGSSSEALSAFPEIGGLAVSCRFPDCSHSHEPGCQVMAAVADGRLDASRLQSYRKLMEELDYVTQRETKSAARVERERWKGVAQKIKEIKKRR